jgi:hypothetical protein
LERLPSRQRSCRVARRRARPADAPSAPVESADRSIVGVEVLKARSVHLGGRRGVSSGCDGDRPWPDPPPRVKHVAVGDAHEVAVPRGLKVQAPELYFEPGWEGVRAAHGIPLAPVLGANHHRDGWRGMIFSTRPLPGAATVGSESIPDTN